MFLLWLLHLVTQCLQAFPPFCSLLHISEPETAMVHELNLRVTDLHISIRRNRIVIGAGETTLHEN